LRENREGKKKKNEVIAKSTERPLAYARGSVTDCRFRAATVRERLHVNFATASSG
jgi:hypothetical protein